MQQLEQAQQDLRESKQGAEGLQQQVAAAGGQLSDAQGATKQHLDPVKLRAQAATLQKQLNQTLQQRDDAQRTAEQMTAALVSAQVIQARTHGSGQTHPAAAPPPLPRLT